MEDNMVAILELGISTSSYELIRNICEDAGVESVEKDFMSIIVDVYDNVISGQPEVTLKIMTDSVELFKSGNGEDTLLLGAFRAGETSSSLNALTDTFYKYHVNEDDGDEEEKETEGEGWEEDDALTFVVAVGEIDDDQVMEIQGKINTMIATQPMTFDEGSVVNITLDRLENFHID